MPTTTTLTNCRTTAATYSYDAEGNLSQRQSQTLGNTTYRWDAENRLIALEDSDHPATRSEFHYDALGRRIGIQDFSNGISQRDDRLIYCGSRLCARQDTLSGQFTRYYHEAASRNGLGHYYHRDHLGSVRAVTDDTLATYSYDPYGRQTMLSGPADSSDFGYTGHYWHAASGLALAPYRAYDADIGRWLSRDPIGEAGGINIYAYVGNNTLNYVDPLGLYKTINCKPKQEKKIENACPIAQEKADKAGIGKEFSEILDKTTFDCAPPSPKVKKDCAINWDSTIYLIRAFDKKACGSLESTIGHEGTHSPPLSYPEDKAFIYEYSVFGTQIPNPADFREMYPALPENSFRNYDQFYDDIILW